MVSGEEILVRPVREEDSEGWARMRRILFPDFDPPEIKAFFEAGGFDNFAHSAVFVAETAGGALVGFAEATARPYAEGCVTSPVAYLEGWFVDEAWRKRGVGALLVRAVEDWGRSLGMTEFASDAAPDNLTSRNAHQALGFREEGLVICFTKKL